MAATVLRVRPAAQNLAHHSGGHGRVRYGVDQDEASGAAMGGVGIQKQRTGGLDFDHADAVELERGGRLGIEGLHVHAVADVFDPGLDRLRSVFQEVALAWIERLGIHPNQGGEKVRRHRRRLVGGGEHLSAADVELILERDRNRHGRDGRARSPSKVVMLLTRLVLPEGRAMTRSPGHTDPEAICPAKPR